MLGKGIPSDHRFIDRALSVIREFMKDDRQASIYEKFIAPALTTEFFSRAISRKVTGSMNELAMSAADLLETGDATPHHVGFSLNTRSCSALGSEDERGFGTPKDALKRLAARTPVTRRHSDESRPLEEQKKPAR